MNRRVAVIIPAYNEEETIADVVKGVIALGSGYHPIVVNDSSKDNTTAQAERAGAVVIELPFNLGIGGAVQTGFKYTVDQGYDACIQVDGDGQHPPHLIPAVVEPLFADKLDVVVGSRLLGSEYKIPIMRSIGIKAFSLFLRFFCGITIRDTTSGFRAFNRRSAEFCAKWYPQDYPEPESLLLMHMKGFKIGEVPVEMSRREHGASSITPMRSVYYMTKVLMSMFIDLFKRV
jgi:glycosyltransferase involved in cell wall biosynthesis